MYEVPLRRALTEQFLIMGAPKGVMIFNATLAAMFVISLHFFYILILNAIIHFGAIFLSKRDDRFFECLQTYVKQKKIYNV